MIYIIKTLTQFISYDIILIFSISLLILLMGNYVVSGFKISENYFIGYLQGVLFKLISMFGLILGFLFSLLPFSAIIWCDPTDVDTNQNNDNNQEVNNQNKDIHIHTQISVGNAIEKASKVLESGISQGIGQIGLSASIAAGFSSGIAAGSGQSPKIKAILGLGGGLAGAAFQVGGSAANRAVTQIQTKNLKTNYPNDTPPSPGNEFIPSMYESSLLDGITDNSVELLLSSILLLNFINLVVILILLMTFISKIILSYNYQLNWIDRILPISYSGKVKSSIFKIINILNKLRDFNLIMIIIMLIFNSAGILYLFSIFYLNLEDMCKLYLEYINNK